MEATLTPSLTSEDSLDIMLMTTPPGRQSLAMVARLVRGRCPAANPPIMITQWKVRPSSW
jgi:hypothetical protein